MFIKFSFKYIAEEPLTTSLGLPGPRFIYGRFFGVKNYLIPTARIRQSTALKRQDNALAEDKAPRLQTTRNHALRR